MGADWMIYPAFIFVLGMIIGSFLNVVIYRLPLEKSVIFPRSHCPGCHAPIAWNENIPLVSYLWLRGKCSRCENKISLRYPFVEVLTGLLFWWSWRDMGFDVAQFRIWFFISVCIAVFFIDLDHRIIPNELSLGAWAVGLATAFFDFRNEWMQLWMASFAGFGLFFGFAYLYEKFTGRVGLGGGDIKFMGAVGVFLGLGGVWSTLLLSSIIGSIIGIGYGYFTQQKGLLKVSIPYGPFLVVGAMVELFFEVSTWMNP